MRPGGDEVDAHDCALRLLKVRAQGQPLIVRRDEIPRTLAAIRGAKDPFWLAGDSRGYTFPRAQLVGDGDVSLAEVLGAVAVDVRGSSLRKQVQDAPHRGVQVAA